MQNRNNYKFLIIGLGSMGKRRVRNLLFHNISKDTIFGFDLSQERCDEVEAEYGISKTFQNFDEAIEAIDPDVFIISTPPDKHGDYFLYAAKKKKHFFVEVPTSMEGYDELFPLLDNSFVSAPSCTFRYFPGVVKIKSLLQEGKIGKVLSFQHYLGQYLPDWHPYEDYSKIYFAKKGTGGAREMFPYELVWLSDVLESSIKKVVGIRGKISDLNMTADDIYSSSVQFENGVVGNMMIDLLNRSACRTLKIVGTEGTLDWDWLGKKITIFDARTNTSEIIDLDSGKKMAKYNTGEEAYEAEMGDFLQAIEGKKEFPYSFQEDKEILEKLDAFVDLE